MLQELALVNNFSDSAENKTPFHSVRGATLPPPLPLLCFSLSTAAPSSHLGIAQVSPCYLLLNLVQLVTREKCSINQVADAGREEWRRWRRINKRAESLPVTISWVRRWRTFPRSPGTSFVKTSASCRAPKVSEWKTQALGWDGGWGVGGVGAFLKQKSSLPSVACSSSDKVGLPRLKCVNERGKLDQ